MSLRSVDGTQITQIERMNADWFATLTVFFTQRRRGAKIRYAQGIER